MGLVARIHNAFSSETRRLMRIAQIAGESERLAVALQRHAELCDYTNIKSGLAETAAAETADAKALRNLLAPYRVWPTRSSAPERDGANNWARLSDDLAAEVEMVRALNAAIADWEGADREVAGRLREVVKTKEATLDRLRDLTLRCDPQAFD
jgi:rubrerythrin